ncbi:MAG: hypothetical protein HY040_25790 [Planctomycetes bacterium]|nr:hypothetical protein [Planctomycetota bacterium]
MSIETAEKQQYMISVFEPEKTVGHFIFTFVPKGLQQVRGPGGTPKRVPQFIVAVQQDTGDLSFDWSGSPDDPGAVREEMQKEIAGRMRDREVWIDRVTSLAAQVEQWARELGWSTRRVEKKLDDARIGKHRVPALLMQEETCRILLEPVGRSAAGAEGVVDLYLMPAYDDIASLYYYGNQWNLHYMYPGAKPVAAVRDADHAPLSKETLERVLAEMRRHAA